MPACLSVCWDYLYTVIHTGVRDNEKLDTQIAASFIPHAAVCSPTCPLPARLTSESYENFFSNHAYYTKNSSSVCIWHQNKQKRKKSCLPKLSWFFFFYFLTRLLHFCLWIPKADGGKKVSQTLRNRNKFNLGSLRWFGESQRLMRPRSTESKQGLTKSSRTKSQYSAAVGLEVSQQEWLRWKANPQDGQISGTGEPAHHWKNL